MVPGLQNCWYPWSTSIARYTMEQHNYGGGGGGGGSTPR